MTVAAVQAMSNTEWVGWFAWYSKRAQDEEVERKMAENRKGRR
jgi:hypothetical protein